MKLCIAEMDLNQHAFIEASAGTGKTYSIEEIFCRLLTGNFRSVEDTAIASDSPPAFANQVGLDPTNILVLTFTEKATTELKQRIMARLVEELPKLPPDSAIAKHFSLAIDVFGEAPIRTIHGFCATVLSDFGFEAGQSLEMQVVNDLPILERVYGRVMRTFAQRYGAMACQILGLLRFHRNDRNADFKALVISLVSRINFQSDKIINFHEEVFQKPVEQKNGRHFFDDCFFSAASNIYSQLSKQNAKHRDFVDVLYGFRQQPHEIDIYQIYETLVSLETKAKAKNTPRSDTDNPDTSSGKLFGVASFERLIQNCPNISSQQCESFLLPLRQLVDYFHRLKTEAFNFILWQLYENAQAYKRDRAYLSFDDMLKMVRDGVCQQTSDVLRQALFQRYQAVLIDEFQDTDSVQWDIFRTIFLHDQNMYPAKPLILVGDPKQAIYSFRRADIFTYFSAADTLQTMVQARQAQSYFLLDNYRSTRQLLHIFNVIFGEHESGSWFFSSQLCNQLRYQNVSYPEKPSAKQRLAAEFWENLSPDIELKSLNIFEIDGKHKSESAKKLYARFIATEIKRLLGLRNNQQQPLFHAGDFCVLVRGRSYAVFIEEAFKSLNISYSYYKKPHLFASDEASQLEVLLAAIASPDDIYAFRQVVLSDFFGFPLASLLSDDETLLRPVRELFRYWQKTLEMGKIGEFFRSIYEDSNLRVMTNNHRHIVEILLENCAERQPNASKLLEKLKFLRNCHLESDEALTYPLSIDSREHVQLMTMHVSKGLQFPVVFVFGNFSKQNKKGDYFRFHKEVNGQMSLHWDFTLQNDHQALHNAEETAENERLYYVALTRAERLLYLAHYEISQSQYGCFGAFLSQRLKQCFGNTAEQDDVRWIDGHNWLESLAQAGSDKIVSDEQADLSVTADVPMRSEVSLGGERNLAASIVKLRSFSSLAQLAVKSKQSLQDFAVRQVSPTEDLTFVPPHNLTADNFNLNPFDFYRTSAEDEVTALDLEQVSQLLPVDTKSVSLSGGIETGNMMHELFEKLDWLLVGDLIDYFSNTGCIRNISAAVTIAEQIFVAYDCSELLLRREALTLMQKTLSVPLAPLNCCLLDIPSAQRFHELDFVLQPFFNSEQQKSPYFDLLRGAIDLVFYHQGKYYIADWKTNTLADYSSVGLNEAMRLGHYFLQADIYKRAVCAWLDSRGIPSSEAYGGVFYFFVRGIDAQGQGIWFSPFTYSQSG